MRVLMFLADYANMTGDGKLNVLGIFGQINARTFPHKHRAMVLIAQIALDIGERPITRPIAFRLLDDDAALFEITGDVPFQQDENGHIRDTNIVVPLNDIVFPKPGDYEIRFYVNEETKHTLPIKVVQIEDSK